MINNNIDFSNIDSELKAYLIGFFYADATLTDYVITVRLSLKDKNHLEKMANILNKEVFFKDVKNKKNGKTYKVVGFNICSKMSVDSLRKIGFVPNKTYQIDDIVFNNIPDDFKRHFIRGYLDGDGTIFYSKYKRTVDSNESERCSVGFVSINKKLLQSINDYLTLTLELSDEKELRSDKFDDIEKNERYWRLIYNGNRISKKILDFLYDNSTIYMDRKYDEYLKIKVYKPKGYHFRAKDNAWRVPYKDENNIQRWKNFKKELDAQEFLDEIRNKNKIIKTYEKFIGKVVK